MSLTTVKPKSFPEYGQVRVDKFGDLTHVYDGLQWIDVALYDPLNNVKPLKRIIIDEDSEYVIGHDFCVSGTEIKRLVNGMRKLLKETYPEDFV